METSSAWPQLTIFGDSIVHGGVDDECGGWAIRLKLYLMRSGQGDHVFVLGKGGDTSLDVLARFDREIVARAPSRAIIFAVGVNDLSFRGSTGSPRVSDEEFAHALQELGTRAEKSAPEVVFLSLPPLVFPNRVTIGGELFYRTPERYQRLNHIIESVCRDGAYRFLDVTSSIANLQDIPDETHPNARGHQCIYECVRDELKRFGVIA